MKPPVIVVFARVPLLCVGKRRLASQIGDRAALRFWRDQLGAFVRKMLTLRHMPYHGDDP